MSQSDTSDYQLRRISVGVRPTDRFPIPNSDGYSVYGSLLGVLDDVDEAVSNRVHDSQLGSLHSSGLQGSFAGSDRPYHKTARPDETYELTLGIVDPNDQAIFQALVNALVIENEYLELSHGTLRVETVESENTTHAELLDRAGDCANPEVTIDFRTATCIKDGGEVTTMFPAREKVFLSLLKKWNWTAPDDLELDLGRDELLENVIEKPDARTYNTHSVLVNRATNQDGENRNIFRQGFTGKCTYGFKDASEAVVNAVVALALFGEFSGVGSAVARGCGSVGVTVDA